MRRTLATLLAVTTLALSASAAPADTLTWDSRTLAIDAPELPDAAARAAEAWAPFARENDYHLTLIGDDARLLLIGEGGRSLTTRQVELARRTIELFEKDLPTPPPVSSGGGDKKDAKPASDEIPEDPEGPPPGWNPPDPDAEIVTWTWGAGNASEPDSQTMVLLVLKNERDYGKTLDVLAGIAEYLADWSREARSNLGFVLESPLAGAYVLNADGQEEWNPDNELVNRVAQLCLLRRFGQQPNWIVQGYAWHAEIELLGAVYAFPYRDEFVYATEHTDWDKDLRRRLKDGAPDLKDLTRWSRGTYDHEASRVAWGLVDWTVKVHPRQLSAILGELRRFRDEDNRKQTSKTEWERDPDYEVPNSKQRDVFQERLGKSFLRDFAKAYG